MQCSLHCLWQTINGKLYFLETEPYLNWESAAPKELPWIWFLSLLVQTCHFHWCFRLWRNKIWKSSTCMIFKMLLSFDINTVVRKWFPNLKKASNFLSSCVCVAWSSFILTSADCSCSPRPWTVAFGCGTCAPASVFASCRATTAPSPLSASAETVTPWSGRENWLTGSLFFSLFYCCVIDLTYSYWLVWMLCSSGRDKICTVWDLKSQQAKRTVPVYEVRCEVFLSFMVNKYKQKLLSLLSRL